MYPIMTSLSCTSSTRRSIVVRNLLIALASIVGASGCAAVDLKRVTYQALRQSDCVVNQLQDVCQQSYTHDYHEYVRLRRNFLLETIHESES